MEQDFVLGLEGNITKKNAKNMPFRIALIGCGSHAFRNILPTIHFLPVKLVAVCDINQKKANLFANRYPNCKAYYNYNELLSNEKLDAVILEVGFGKDGRPLYPELAMTCIKKKIPVWIEKPPAANSTQIKELIKLSNKTNGIVQVAFRKMFMPSISALNEIIHGKSFGGVSSYYYRYPLDLPTNIFSVELPQQRRFLDDFMHPASVLTFLFGAPKNIIFKRTSDNGGMAIINHKNFSGILHFVRGTSGASPLERIEIVGKGENVIVDNSVDIKYYQNASRKAYGVETSFYEKNSFCKSWSPEFSLGQLYNKGTFLLGYYFSLEQFFNSLRNKKNSPKAGLNQALDVMQFYEMFGGKENSLVLFGQIKPKNNIIIRTAQIEKKCASCGAKLVSKEGWDLKCPSCGKTHHLKNF